MQRPKRSVLSLALLTLALGYAVVTQGGDRPADSSITLLIVGLAGLASLLDTSGLRGLTGTWSPNDRGRPSVGDRIVDVAVLLFPVYIAFQLLPLPLGIVRGLSPARAELADALAGVTAVPSFVPLAITPPTTWVHLPRIAGYALVFVIVRRMARRSMGILWWLSVPLVIVGAIEVAWALALPPVDGHPMLGTYLNKNHFAGLLEMILPFALMGGVSALYRGRGRTALSSAWAAAAGAALIATAVAIVAAIGLSLSKGGLLSTLGSLFVMAVLWFGPRLSPGKRWSLVLGLALVGAFVLVFVTPPALVQQFGVVVSEDASEGRVPIWNDTLRMVRAYPLFGVGLGNFYPGLLRYQTYGLNLAWVNAHNDYLQLLSELGIVGWLIPAGLIGLVFWSAVRAGLSSVAPERRFLGLACVGGLTAILLHSSSDFNTYVLSNAMVLAWIAGLSASLPTAGLPPEPQPTRGRQLLFVAAPLVLASFAILSAGARLVFLQSDKNVETERRFCAFGMCDADAVMAALGPPAGEAATTPVPPEVLLEYLRRDPASPSRWDDLGEALQKAGRTTQARYAFARAVALAPRSPTILQMAADFHFDVGENQAALALLSQILRAGGEFDEPVFADLEYRHVSADDALKHVLADSRSLQAYFRRLAEGDQFQDLCTVWQWMFSRGDANDLLTSKYVDVLLRHGQAEAATRDWARYAGGRSPGYPDVNRLFNGDFETDPTGSALDWRIDSSHGATIDFDRDIRRSGGRSLRVQFDGTKNPGDIGVQQRLFLDAGKYRFRAYVRTKDVSTDEGVAFRLASEGTTPRVDLRTESLRGSTDWTLVERQLEVPPGGALVRLSLVRKPSLKFDKLIRGTIWVEQVSLNPEPSITRP